ncbi:MAG: DNA polymerase III subunit delta, partial [Dehalococcoidia bacterium]
MIYVYHGEDDFSAAEALRHLIEAVGTDDLRESNVTQMTASEFTIDRFGAAAMVVPFLADRRLVVVRGLLGAGEGQRNARRGRRPANEKPPGDGIGPLLEQLPPTTDVAFMEGKLSAGNTLLGVIKELGPERSNIKEFPALRRDALASWVRQRVQAKGASIENPAVAELVEVVGGNLWAMDSEIEKLSLYCTGRPIATEDVVAMVATTRESSVFELVDAIMDKRPNVALEAMDRLLNDGASGTYLVSMVARQARMLAIAQELVRNKVPQASWGPRLGTQSDFVVRKTSEQARRFPPDAVRELYRLLVEADLAMKSSDTTEEL